MTCKNIQLFSLYVLKYFWRITKREQIDVHDLTGYLQQTVQTKQQLEKL